MRGFITLFVICIFRIVYSQSYFEVSTLPSCEYGPTGVIKIHIIKDDLEPDWDTPFDLEAINTSNGLVYSTTSIEYDALFENVASGPYEITIYVSNTCELTFETEVASLPNENLNLQLRTKSPTCGNLNGFVEVFSNNDLPPGLNYAWNMGSTSRKIISLGPGYYCVTVTDDDCGYFTSCALLVDSEPIISRSILENISTCEAGESIQPCDGKLGISYKNLTPGSISWTGPGGFTSNSSLLTGLCLPGTYTVTIHDGPGCDPIIRSFKLCCCDETIYQEPFPGLCEHGSSDIPLHVEGEVFHCYNNNNEGIISITILGGQGSEPTFKWTGPNGSIPGNKIISNLVPGEYCVTVKDGCDVVTKCFTVQNFNCNGSYTNAQLIDLFIEEEEDPCPGSLTGEISINVPSEPGDNPVVFIDPRFPLELEQIYTGFIAHAYNLPANETITITIEIDGCTFTIDYFTGQGFFTEVFDHLEGLVCHYTQYCGANYVGDIFEPADVDIPNGNVNFFGECTAPVSCNGEKIGDYPFPPVRVSITEYVAIINSFLAQELITPVYYRILWQDVVRRELRPCDKVNYCPGDLSIISEQEWYELVPYYESEITTDENGCTHVTCPFPFSDINFCPDDLELGPILDDLFDPNNFCTTVEQPFVQLIAWEAADFFPPEYYDSSLKEFVDHNINDPRSNCTTVRFCCNSFKFLSSDIDEVLCPPAVSCYNFGGEYPTNCTSHWSDDHTTLFATCTMNTLAACPGYMIGLTNYTNLCRAVNHHLGGDPDELQKIRFLNQSQVNELLDYDRKKADNFIVFPIIFSDELNVVLPDAEVDGINLMDQQGKIIEVFKNVHEGHNLIKTQNLSQGMYYLQFYNSIGQNITLKPVIHE